MEETYEEFATGEIHLKHSGAYVAKFHVSWDEITGYDGNGKEQTARRNWDQNDKNKTAGFKTVITLGGNCRNINIKAQGKTGLVWDPWHTPLDKKGLALVPSRSIEIKGTTLNQKAECKPAD